MKNKTKTILFICALLFSAALRGQHTAHQNDTADTVKKSIPTVVTADVGSAKMTVRYHSPAVRGRTIWGGLVPYGEVWVTGAHSATTFEFNKTISINNVSVAPGKYAIFTIPGKDYWVVIINQNWDQHLADNYKASDDIVRLQVKPSNCKMEERLIYLIKPDEDGTGGKLMVAWEKIEITVPFKIK